MNDELEYRGYVFVNSALSSIQKGVQGAHALVEVTEKYQIESNEAASALHEWRESHKTLIFLEAGFHHAILDNYLTFAHHCENLGFPHALFVEDDETMNSMATAFAGIISSDIYDIDLQEYDQLSRLKFAVSHGLPEEDPVDPPEIALARFLRSFSLAR